MNEIATRLLAALPQQASSFITYGGVSHQLAAECTSGYWMHCTLLDALGDTSFVVYCEPELLTRVREYLPQEFDLADGAGICAAVSVFLSKWGVTSIVIDSVTLCSPSRSHLLKFYANLGASTFPLLIAVDAPEVPASSLLGVSVNCACHANIIFGSFYRALVRDLAVRPGAQFQINQFGLWVQQRELRTLSRVSSQGRTLVVEVHRQVTRNQRRSMMPANFEQLDSNLLETPLMLTASVCSFTMTLGQLLQLSPGVQIALEVDTSLPVEILLGEEVLAHGKLHIEDTQGLSIEVVQLQHRLSSSDELEFVTEETR